MQLVNLQFQTTIHLEEFTRETDQSFVFERNKEDKLLIGMFSDQQLELATKKFSAEVQHVLN
jgi:hypothetical protein